MVKKTNSILFEPRHQLIWRNDTGERRLSVTRGHQFLIAIAALLFILVFFFMTISFVYNALSPASEGQISNQIRTDYEARIQALVTERDSLNQELEQARVNSSLLIQNLGNQQDLLFNMERENYEMDHNLNRLRENLIASQNRLDSLNLQIHAQEEQLAAVADGQPVVDSKTISAITATLAETAMARDEARNEVQNLRQEITIADQKSDIEQRRRDMLFQQIETTIETSLVPMKSMLSKTGLNVDQLLSSVQQNYSGTGGITSDADFSSLANTDEGLERIENVIDDLDELARLSFAVQSLPLGNPVLSSYRMTSGFGYRRHPITGRRKMHSGIDMAAPRGTPIFSPGKGKVIKAGWQSGYGKTIEIQHGNGIRTLYGHLNRIRVSAGQQVELGQRIADMGSTGLSTGPHLHYEIHVNGTAKNPINFLRAANYVQ